MMPTISLASARFIAARTIEIIMDKRPPCPRCDGDATAEHTSTDWCAIVTEAQRQAEEEWGEL